MRLPPWRFVLEPRRDARLPVALPRREVAPQLPGDCGSFDAPGHAPLGVASPGRPARCLPMAAALASACGAEARGTTAPAWPLRYTVHRAAGGSGPGVGVYAANLTATGLGFLSCARLAIGQVLDEGDSRAQANGVWLGLLLLVGVLGVVGLCARLGSTPTRALLGAHAPPPRPRGGRTPSASPSDDEDGADWALLEATSSPPAYVAAARRGAGAARPGSEAAPAAATA